ncbi:MAG TPA: hypothetical protein VGL77_06280 [Armatimonadota bacterium]|jgi:hypothetical protein
MIRFSRALGLIILLAIVAAGLQAANAAPTAEPSIVAKCKFDLLKRRNVTLKDITTVENTPTVWPDASLGMPEFGKVYAQVETPGFKIILEAKNAQYLYTASAKAFKYGGPVAIWSYSMLVLLPVANDPDLNGDLYQFSLLGTNSLRIASGVSAYYPQDGGFVIYTSRTSRSGFDLMLVNAKAAEKTTRLDGAFDFGAAALNKAQDRWAAFVRPTLGAVWNIATNRIGAQAKPQRLPLPEGVQAGRIAWADDKLLILVKKGEGSLCYEATPDGEQTQWTAVPSYRFPAQSYRLNKSETLEIHEVKENGTPDVEVARVWFTGDRKVIATISGLTLRGYASLTLREYDSEPGQYLFIWGEQHGQPATFTVDIDTGEILPGLHGVGQETKPFSYPPKSPPYRIVMAD